LANIELETLSLWEDKAKSCADFVMCDRIAVNVMCVRPDKSG